MHDQSVTHWSSLEQTSTELINADDCIVPKQVYNLLYFLAFIISVHVHILFGFGLKYTFLLLQRGHGSQSVAMVQVTTMAMDSNLLVVGGFQGELICKVFLLHKYSPTLVYSNSWQINLTYCFWYLLALGWWWGCLQHKGYRWWKCNHQLFRDLSGSQVRFDAFLSQLSCSFWFELTVCLWHVYFSGSRRLVAANNDCSIRIFDTEYFDLLKHYVFPWSVNVSRPLTVLCPVVLSSCLAAKFSSPTECFCEPKWETLCCPGRSWGWLCSGSQVWQGKWMDFFY